MLLIDKEKLVKHIEEAWDWNMLDEKSAVLLRQTLVDIDNEKVIKAIPTKWMQQAVVEMMYDGEKVTDKDRYILNKLIARWEKENDHK